MLERIGVFMETSSERADTCWAAAETLLKSLKIPPIILGETKRINAKQLTGFIAEGRRELFIMYLREVAHALEERVRDAGCSATSLRDSIHHFFRSLKSEYTCRPTNNISQISLS